MNQSERRKKKKLCKQFSVSFADGSLFAEVIFTSERSWRRLDEQTAVFAGIHDVDGCLDLVRVCKETVAALSRYDFSPGRTVCLHSELCRKNACHFRAEK